jgi:phosphatidylglycerol lysyltransferase
VVAFANVLRGQVGDEITVDLMRYSSQAPDNVMEYLFIQLMLHGRAEGFGHFNLGMAPLAGLENRALAPLWNRVGAFVYRFGENFYNFQGLREYKEKFDPVWEPRYLASPGGLMLPRILTNVASLIAGGVTGIVKK